MATATSRSRAARHLARHAARVREPASMEFVIFEDNGGEYHWTIIAGDGATLARSVGFGSFDDAELGAQQICDGAASARYDRRGVVTSPVDLVARRDAARDASDAERWLDEGGSFSSGAVATWPAGR
jgi:uncharacterized protein YegP (UPF0339 family)